MRSGDLLEAAAGALRASGIEPARLEAEVLLAAATGWERATILAHPERDVPENARRTLLEWLGRRTQDRVPLQYLTRRQEFWSLALYVDERVLIPRPETECLVEEVLRRAGSVPERWADVGTGCGAVALALASERTDCLVVAVDVSPAALEVAAVNCGRHSEPGGRVRLVASDLLGALAERRGSLTRIAANLPYLAGVELAGLAPEVSSHEPRLALVAGERGETIISRLVPQAAGLLAAGGTLHLEIAPGLQSVVESLLLAGGLFCSIEIRRDLQGHPRVVTAVRNA